MEFVFYLIFICQLINTFLLVNVLRILKKTNVKEKDRTAPSDNLNGLGNIIKSAISAVTEDEGLRNLISKVDEAKRK